MSLTTAHAKLSQYAHQFREGTRRRRIFVWLSAVILELDCALDGLGGASRRIRAERSRRQACPRAETVTEGV
jgi:hypothetical protein